MASVDPESGIVTAKAAGTAKITATVENNGVKKSAYVTVTITDPYMPSSVKLTEAATQKRYFGETFSFEAQPFNKAGNARANISCKVDTKGRELVDVVVDGKKITVSVREGKEGTATVTVTATRGKTQKTAKMTISVLDPRKPQKIAIANGTSVTQRFDQDLPLSVLFTPETSATDVEWKLDKSGAAIAAMDGNVLKPTGEKTGTATVTATAVYCDAQGKITKKTAKVKVKLVDPKVLTGVKIASDSGKTVHVDETLNLTAKVEPEIVPDESVTVEWKSSAPKVAKVEDGVVTGLKAGSATITVTVTQNLNSKKTTKKATFKVKVTEP